MKKLFLLLVVVCFVPAMVLGQNMLANPGFEDMADDSSWIKYAQTGSSIEMVYDSTTAHAGGYWAKCTSTQGGMYLLYQNTFPASPGQIYTFSSFIKDVSPSDPGAVFAALKISAKSATGSTFYFTEEYQSGVTSEWQEFTSTMTMPEGTANIQVVIVVHGADDAPEASYGFDDVSLELNGYAPDYNLLTNPGFEDGDADDNGVPDGWIGYAQTGASMQLMNDGTAHSGNYWAKCTSTNGGFYLLYRNTFPVLPGNAYKFSSFIKDVSPSDPGAVFAALKITAKKSTGSNIKAWEEYQEGVTSEWQEFSNIKTMPEGTAYIQVVIVVHGADDAPEASYGFDDINFELVYETPEIPTELNWLANPDFEDGDADSNGVPDGWLGYGQTGASLEIMNNVEGNSGGTWIKCTSTQGGYYLLYQNTFPANENEVWKLSAFFKDISPTDLDVDFAALKISAKNSTGGTFYAIEEYQEGVTTYWQQYSSTMIMPEGTAYIQAVIVIHAADGAPEASYGIDDVRLEMVHELSYANPSFELDENSDGAPDDWMLYGKAAQTTFTFHNDSLSHYGNNWVEASVDSGNTYYLIYLPLFQTSPGEIFSWRSFIKRTTVDSLGDFVYLKMACKSVTGSTFLNYEIRQLGVTQEWKDYSNTQVMPYGTAYMQPSLVVKKSGGDSLDVNVAVSYGFDDIRLIRMGFTDIDPPVAPTVTAESGTNDYTNVVTWTDLAGEDKETYSVYVSEEDITDITADGVNLLASEIGRGTQTYKHYIRNLYEDADLSYYYAVVAIDSASNIGVPGVSAKLENLAKSISAITLNVPADFAVDGDISEWDSTGVKAFEMTPGTDKIASGEFDDDADLSFRGFIGIDADNLYISLEVTDDEFCYQEGASYYKNDAIFLYLGLYNQTDKHQSTKRGMEPDYRLNLQQDYLRNFNAGSGMDTLYLNGDANYTFVDIGNHKYVVEAIIPFADLLVGNQANDSIYVATIGDRIPIDIEICDSDLEGTREGLLVLSLDNDDESWKCPVTWTYTWIDDSFLSVDEASTVLYTYELKQNYPNPFNPTTHISYSLAKPSNVKLTVYNIIGQEVTRLVQEKQDVGKHMVTFDAHNFSTGVYFYKIQADNFVKTKKMLLVK